MILFKKSYLYFYQEEKKRNNNLQVFFQPLIFRLISCAISCLSRNKWPLCKIIQKLRRSLVLRRISVLGITSEKIQHIVSVLTAKSKKFRLENLKILTWNVFFFFRTHVSSAGELKKYRRLYAITRVLLFVSRPFIFFLDRLYSDTTLARVMTYFYTCVYIYTSVQRSRPHGHRVARRIKRTKKYVLTVRFRRRQDLDGKWKKK